MAEPQRTFSIEVKVTSRCNQECFHCANSDGPSADSDIDWRTFTGRLEEWARTKDESVSILKEVRLTGGEPLVNFEAVLGIAECCQRLGIASGINTNGLLFDAEKIRSLKERGVRVMKVSFDAVTMSTYNRLRGPLPSFEEFYGIIRELVKSGFKVILRFTLSRINRDQLRACYDVARDMGIYKFQIKPLIRSGRAKGLDAYLSPEEVSAVLRELSQVPTGNALATEVLCWPPAPGIDFFFKICGNVNKIYVAPSLVTTICNYIEGNGRQVVGDLAAVPLEVLLRHRADESLWIEDVAGHRLVKGCPNIPYFKDRSR